MFFFYAIFFLPMDNKKNYRYNDFNNLYILFKINKFINIFKDYMSFLDIKKWGYKDDRKYDFKNKKR